MVCGFPQPEGEPGVPALGLGRYRGSAAWLWQTEGANLEEFPAPEVLLVAVSRDDGAATGC